MIAILKLLSFIRSKFLVKKEIKMAKATWNEKVIAESNNCVVVEGNNYFPVSDVHQEYLKPSSLHTHCPWKGEASYYTLDVDGKSNQDAAWYYPEPKEAAKEIKDHIAFWKGVKVEK